MKIMTDEPVAKINQPFTFLSIGLKSILDMALGLIGFFKNSQRKCGWQQVFDSMGQDVANRQLLSRIFGLIREKNMKREIGLWIDRYKTVMVTRENGKDQNSRNPIEPGKIYESVSWIAGKEASYTQDAGCGKWC